MEKLQPTISVIIPVKNSIATIDACIEGIRSQTLYDQAEIIAVDSGSTDGSLEYLQSQPDVLVHTILPEEFNHGLTRNLGVGLARGEFIVMTVQDAWATNEHWLECLMRHFKDSSVAGVCGLQVVKCDKDKNPHQWFRPINPPDVKRVSFSSPDEFLALLPDQKKRLCRWDDVNAAYRKEVLLKVPFRRAFFAEDTMWAKDVLEAGYSLVYDSHAKVYHYHYQSYDYVYERTLTQLYFGYKIFGHVRKYSVTMLEYVKIIYRNFKYGIHPKWIWHNIQICRARGKSYNDFYKHLNKGEKSLDLFYNSVCKVPPQGRLAVDKR